VSRNEFVYSKHHMCVVTTQTYGCVDWFGVCWLPPISFVNVVVVGAEYGPDTNQ
jgi:hypothetical protein